MDGSPLLLQVDRIILMSVILEFFPEVEQIAFCTAHVVPGVTFSDDPLLQGRNFSYFDTQITRLGPNFQQIPINRPGTYCYYLGALGSLIENPLQYALL